MTKDAILRQLERCQVRFTRTSRNSTQSRSIQYRSMQAGEKKNTTLRGETVPWQRYLCRQRKRGNEGCNYSRENWRDKGAKLTDFQCNLIDCDHSMNVWRVAVWKQTTFERGSMDIPHQNILRRLQDKSCYAAPSQPRLKFHFLEVCECFRYNHFRRAFHQYQLLIALAVSENQLFFTVTKIFP